MQPEANGRSTEAAMASVCDITDDADETDEKATEEQNVEYSDDDTGKVEYNNRGVKIICGVSVDEESVV